MISLENLDSQVWAFLEDDRFMQWILAPDEETNAWWEEWMAMHPGELNALFKAREIARELAYTQAVVETEQLAKEIWSGIEKELGASVVEMPVVVRRRRGWVMAAAVAAGLLVVGFGIIYWGVGRRKPEVPPQQVASVVSQDELHRINGTSSNQQVCLVDGTRITLQPGAAIRHALYLEKDRREVYLEGNAFFEIAKDAHRPFTVYTPNLIVKVLGTSFRVVTNKDNGEVSIVVETGKVSVARKDNPGKAPLILERDEQAVYKPHTQALLGTVASGAGSVVDRSVAAPELPFSYESTPVVQIFKQLEGVYGVPFHYDEKVFAACKVTTTLALGDLTFEEKLRIFCNAIEAEYRLDVDGVWIQGRGCK